MSQIKLDEYGFEQQEDGQIVSKGNYPPTLKHSDIGEAVGDRLDVIIQKVEENDFPDGKKTVLEVYGKTFDVLDDTHKGVRRLILNKTNMKRLIKGYGLETDDWEGKRIELYRDDTTYKGEPTECIRITHIKV